MHEERLACLAAGESEAEWRERKRQESNARGRSYFSRSPEYRQASRDRVLRYRAKHPKEAAVPHEVRPGPRMSHEEKKQALWIGTFGHALVHDEATRFKRVDWQFRTALTLKTRGGVFRSNLLCKSCGIMNGLSKIDEMVEIEPHGHVCPECWEAMTENLWDGALL